MATHSHMLASIESSPPKKAAHYNTAAAAARPLHLELGGEPAAHRDPLDPGVVGEPVAVRRGGLPHDEWVGGAAAGGGVVGAPPPHAGRAGGVVPFFSFCSGWMCALPPS